MHKFGINRLNFSILLPSILIVFIALSVFYSIDTHIFRSQLSFLFVSLFFYLIFLNIDYKLFGFFAKYMYFAMIILLLGLFFIGIEARGAVRWVDVFGIRIQFSEVIKPFFIIFIASYLSKHEKKDFQTFIKAILLLSPIFALTLSQPDLGSAMVYLIVLFFMLLADGFSIKYFLTIGAGLALSFPVIFSFLHDYQRHRLLSFINPASDPTGTSYNAVQSLISIGSGGFFGKGFGHATQSILKFLPERHTDFIFATISESLGFIGAFVLIALYVFLLTRIIKILSFVNDDFSRLILQGFYFLFLTQIFLNIGMNIGIVPIVGITLPLASYGGSSLLTSFIILGITSSIAFDNSKHKMLEIS